MAKDYSSIINNATSQYNATIAGYQKTLQQQQVAQQGVMSGYNDLQRNVLSGLEGGSNAEKQAIIDQYAQASGKAQMGLIGRGLGNSTVTSSVQRGLTLDHAKAQTDRANRFANTAAGYQTQLGLAGLGYAGNALNTNLGFAGQGLQYQGQGAFQLGNLAQNVGQMELQSEMQDKAFRHQLDMQRLNQVYGAGRGGGGGGGSIGPKGGSEPARGPGGGGQNYVYGPRGMTGTAAAGSAGPYGSSGGDFGGASFDSGTWYSDANGMWTNDVTGAEDTGDLEGWGTEGVDWNWE